MHRMLIGASLLALAGATPSRAMEVTSPNIVPGAPLADTQVKDGCGGTNRSPALSWSDAPKGTESFAITVFDPDAHGGWWHWVALDIPASVYALAEGAGLPAGAVAASNDFGDARYDGPCPPPGSGAHHYEFTVWALPQAHVPLDGSPTGSAVENYLKTHALAHAEIVGTYERQ